MDMSVFPDKEIRPDDKELAIHLASTYSIWLRLCDFVMEQYPEGKGEWTYPGKKYGWNFRIKDKKRAIIYFLPRDNYFKVAFVFGQKAMERILLSDISTEIKSALSEAHVYAEGRGIQIDVHDNSKLQDIKKLVEIKLLY